MISLLFDLLSSSPVKYHDRGSNLPTIPSKRVLFSLGLEAIAQEPVNIQ